MKITTTVAIMIFFPDLLLPFISITAIVSSIFYSVVEISWMTTCLVTASVPALSHLNVSNHLHPCLISDSSQLFTGIIQLHFLYRVL